jgi:hypothetical protein
MSNLPIIMLYGLIVSVICIISIVALYRSIEQSQKLLISNIQRTEQDLFNDLQQIDITELSKTSAGRDLFTLLSQEHPEILYKLYKIPDVIHLKVEAHGDRQSGTIQFGQIIGAFQSEFTWKEAMATVSPLDIVKPPNYRFSFGQGGRQ